MAVLWWCVSSYTGSIVLVLCVWCYVWLYVLFVFLFICVIAAAAAVVAVSSTTVAVFWRIVTQILCLCTGILVLGDCML